MRETLETLKALRDMGAVRVVLGSNGEIDVTFGPGDLPVEKFDDEKQGVDDDLLMWSAD